MSERVHLRALADRVGVLPDYRDPDQPRRIADDDAAALLQAMGFDVSSEDAARAALERLERHERQRILPPAVVVPERGGRRQTIEARLPEGFGPTLRWELEVTEEGGERHQLTGAAEPEDAVFRLPLPPRLPSGYHRIRVVVDGGVERREVERDLIVTPATCWTVKEALEPEKAAGLWVNLYTLRSDTDWGVGNLGDLTRVARWAAEEGLQFVGLSPLHAVRSFGYDVSPYSPVSRLFRNPLYLDVPAIPEFAESERAHAMVNDPAFQRELASLREQDQVDYGRVRWLQRPVLEVLHGEFIARHRGAGTPRGRAYADYRARQGGELEDFATFMALEEHMWREGRSTYWRHWPEELRHPHAPAVAEWRAAHADWVDFHAWCQFELDRQLAHAADAARQAGMAIGLYQDLAVGTSDGGSDVWSFESLFRTGATIGAPPDAYSETGQDWGLPPMDPLRLADDGFRYWIRLLRSAFAHAGALRIDHAMGVQRLFWIPRGREAVHGAYVRYPQDELLGILALESRRHRALVVAEDLGTVPQGFGATLARWGILSSRVLLFERTDGGGFKTASSYSNRALVTTTTHDHAPMAAWWSGSDLAVRRDLGLLDGPAYEEAVRRREQERKELVARLRGHRVLSRSGEPDYPEVLAAMHRMLARTPSPLLGLSLDDLAAETTPVNLPGIGPDRFPSWRRRMRLPLERLDHDPVVAAGLEGARERFA